MNKKYLPIISATCVMFAATLWGLDGIVLRPKLYHLDVPVVVFLEHLIAFAFMAIFLFFERKELKKLNRKDWLAFLWIALFGGAIGTMAITKALFYVGFVHLSVVILLQKLQPVFGISLAMLILKEKPKKDFFLLALSALIGSYFVTFGFNRPHFDTGNLTLVAAMLSILAAFAFGSCTVFGKQALKKINFRVGTYLRFGLTTLLMFLIVAATNRFDKFSAITIPNIWTLLIIVFSTGGVAIFIYYYGLKRVKASHATIYELMFPVSAIIFDYFIHGTILSPGQLLGAIVLIGSITKITLMNKRETPELT